MSKKINLKISNRIKPNLCDLFHKYLHRKYSEVVSNSDYTDDYYDDEDYGNWCGMWDALDVGLYINGTRRGDTSKSGKNKKKHNKSRSRVKDIYTPYSGYEDGNGDDFEDYDLDFTNMNEEYDNALDCNLKEIWFYPDYHEKCERLKFDSLKSFSDFCDSMGYYVSHEAAEHISWYYENHCCLLPSSLKDGTFEVIASHSYGEMFYEVCDVKELGYAD